MVNDPQTARARESRLRRAAKRQGLRLAKAPTRDPRACDYGRWVLYAPVDGQPPHGLTIDEVEGHLLGSDCYGAPS